MKVKIDPDICIGCGLCVSACAEVFRMEGEKAIVYLTAIGDNLKDSVHRAEEECPVTAIIVLEC